MVPVVLPEPQDLRHTPRQVIDLLSDAFAGSPGDDAFDISIVREHWIKSRVEAMYYADKNPVSVK